MALANITIDTAFQTVLGRSATEAELQSYGNFDTAADLQSALYLEPEYALNTMPVARLYQTLLGRDPEASAVNFYGDHLRAGSMNLDGVAGAMLGSSEAAATWGYDGLSDRAFVQQLYRAALGRDGEEQGVDYYVARLETGTLTRAGVAVTVANSAEAIARFGIREFPSMEQSGGDGALVVGVDNMSTMHGFVSGINTVDMDFAGSALNYREISAAAAADLEGALGAANGMFNANTRYVFVAGANDGWLLGDVNGDYEVDTAVTLTGVTSLDGFAQTDIV